MRFFSRLFGKTAGVAVADYTTERSYKNVLSVLEKYSRLAYIPETEVGPYCFSEVSKIGGYPYLRDKDDWPVCPNCGKNMQLFLQLNLSDLPEKKSFGLVQLFYCTTEEPLCESELGACTPFSRAVVCRKIEIDGLSATTAPAIDDLFEEQVITGWRKVKDYPHFEEYKRLGIDLDINDDVYELMELREEGLPVCKDKLFGWPYWIQAQSYPHDRTTGAQMNLLFQFDSKDNLPYIFGDTGLGHLTVSPDNDREMAFGWACT